jgi:hypothetical protein
MPSGKLVKFGVWEDDKFIGTVIYGKGASPYLLNRYDLENTEGCELVRVAMTRHSIEVSRVISITIRMLKKSNPLLRIIVSFADPMEGHIGGIYKAGGWIYSGTMVRARYFRVRGKIVHQRSIGAKGIVQSLQAVREKLDPLAEEVWKDGKHRYLYPLDDRMKDQISKLAQPYPKS